MLSADKLKEYCRQRQMDVGQLADRLAGARFSRKQAVAAVKNWQKGLYKPEPRADDIDRLASALSVEANDITDWRSSYRYAPTHTVGGLDIALSL